MGYSSPEHCGVFEMGVDARSDVYSLGAVWFQLLTGQSPSEMAEGDWGFIYPAVSEYLVDVHPQIARIVGRMLEPEPDRRYTTVNEVKNAVDQAQREIGTRFDFKNTDSTVELAGGAIAITSNAEERLKAVDQVVVEKLIKRLPGEHHAIFTEVDGRFPNHHPDPTVEANLVDLKKLVEEKGLDFGFAFDGDADRIGAVDSKGRVIWGDQLLIILAAPVLEELPGATIIADVKASQTLFDRIAEMGGTPLMWKTGHSLIKSKMKETQAPLAGEMSGHIFFKHQWYGFDDALFAAIRTIRAVSASGNPITPE